MRNPLSIEEFANWCEKQPAEKEYDYTRPSNCAAAQYLKSIGVQNYTLCSDELPKGWDDAVRDGLWTFGALASRLRASLKEQGR